MSIDTILSILDRLNKMHQSLLQIAYQKTEAIKVNNVEQLNDIIKNEQTHVAAINQFEQQRQRAVTEYFSERKIAVDGVPTVGQLIDVASDGEKREEIVHVRNELAKTIDQLQKQNELNKELIFNSLKFVNVTLDLLRPQPEQINYGNTSQMKSKVRLSNFDSQA